VRLSSQLVRGRGDLILVVNKAGRQTPDLPGHSVLRRCIMKRSGIGTALHNHAAYYNPAFAPPPGPHMPLKGWASGAWFIGPDGATLNQMPTSTQRTDSKEWVLMFSVPTANFAVLPWGP
jgi:hypothetical protein